MHEIASLPMLTLVAIGLALAMSWLSYAWIEKPFISLGRKLTVRSDGPISAAPSNPVAY